MYSEFEAQRSELTNAEKLFDLPITGYPNMIEVEKELKNLALVFELYEAQRVRKQTQTQKGGPYRSRVVVILLFCM